MQGTIKYDFEPIIQGSDWSRDLVFSQSGSTLDLTGYTAKMDIRQEPHSAGTLLFTVSTVADSDGSVITCGSTGMNIHIPTTPTSLFTWDLGYYDLKLTSPTSDGSKPFVPIYGTIPTLRNITV